MSIPKILLVDDRPENLITLEAVLEGLQAEKIRATSGKEALNLALTIEFDLILLDVQMPEMDGFEVATLLKKMKRTASIPIIFVTAISKEQKHVHRGYGVGAVDYLTKPIEPELLLNKVKVFLQLQQQKRELADQAVELQQAYAKLEQTNQHLENERNNLKQAQAIAKMGNWSWDVDKQRFAHSEELGKILGLDGNLELHQLLESIHPDERNKIGNAIHEAIRHPTHLELEHRILRSDGRILRVRQVADVIGENKHQVLLCTLHDVSELKEVENQLAMTRQIFEHAIEGVVLTDTNGVIQSVNAAFTDITGYTEEEAVGKTPRILKSGLQESKFYQEMWKNIRDNGSWQGEIWNRRKNGDSYPQLLSIHTIYNYDGAPKSYVGVFFDLSDFKQNEERLQYQTNHDALTGLFNRTLFQDRLNYATAESIKANKYCAVFQLGIDRFKKINDSFGPAFGDQVLNAVAQRLEKTFGQKNSLARLGGDEFGLIEANCEGMQGIVEILQKVFHCFTDPFEIGLETIHLTVSMGVAVAPDNGGNGEVLLKASTLALNKIKVSSPGNSLFFNADLDQEAISRMEMESALRKAIENHEFELHYQPKVSLVSGKMVGMESLVRWNRPGHGMVRPDLFIPMAEETGLIIPMGRWILQEACRQNQKWIDQGYQCTVAVNLSAQQFQDPNLLGLIDSTLAETGLKPENLELEITESMIMGNVLNAIDLMQEIKKRSVGLSIDDFGTGYSSLSYLKRFPIDALKIDQAFIRHLEPDSDDAALVTAIVAMGKSLGLHLVAEGVEEKPQVDFLKALGCDLMQGYYYSKPLPADQFEAFLLSDKNLFE